MLHADMFCWHFNFTCGAFGCIEVLNLDMKHVSLSVTRLQYLCFLAGRCVLSKGVPSAAWTVGEHNRQKASLAWELKKAFSTQGQQHIFFQ